MAEDIYKEVRTFTYPGMTVKVFIPELTPSERAKRMKRIHNQATNLLKEEIKNAR